MEQILTIGNTNENQIKFSDSIISWSNNSMSRSITIILTEDCQLRCKYCYICGKNSFHKITFEYAQTIIDYVLSHHEEFPEEKIVWDFIGGEPFLEIDVIDKICDYIKMQMYKLNHPWFEKYLFTFSTNGLLYHTPKVQDFIKKNKEHLNISISIDGTQKKHDLQRVYPDGRGSYADVAKNIPLWLSQFPRGMTKATIGHDDLNFVKESVLHLWQLGIKMIPMNVIFEDIWETDDDKLFEIQLLKLADNVIEKEYYKEYNCTLFDRGIGFELDRERENNNWCGTGHTLTINPDGNYYPCIRFAQYSLEHKPEIVLGNVNDSIFRNRLRPFLALNRTVQSPRECLDCEVASGCAWCQGFNYDSADTETIYQRATYICKMHKARVRANNYLWNKLDKIVPPAENDERVRRLQMRKGLQTLMVLMDSSASSFCYYDTAEKPQTTISDELLKKIVFYGLTENLSLNLVMGNQPLTDSQREILKWSNYMIFRSVSATFDADGQTMDVFDFESDVWSENYKPTPALVLRIAKENLEKLPEWLKIHSSGIERISLFVKDMDAMSDAELETYQNVLEELKAWLPEREEESPLELSILTDRLQLDAPNHCAAGVKHVTIAPDGQFYVCPGFYYWENNRDFVISDIDTVLKTHELPIKNKQLYQLDHAPICSNAGCDCHQCKRCVWMNKRSTLEVNTPSRQQCVCAHLERNASRDLLEPLFLTEMVEIPEIDYLDPFEKLMENKKPKMNPGEKTDEC